jgi:hypothetical protein
MAKKTPAPAAAGLDDAEIKRFLARSEVARVKHQEVARIIDDCYEYCLPLRQRSYMSSPGDRRTDRLFDTTACEAIQDFASNWLDDIWPTDSAPFAFNAGKAVADNVRSEVDRALQPVAEDIIATINDSNFRAAAHEAGLDYAIASGVLMIEDGDAVDPINCTALPLSECWLGLGPRGRKDRLYRPRKLKVSDIEVLWPKMTWPQGMSEASNPDAELEVLEGIERDYSVRGTERWNYRAVLKEKAYPIASGTYEGHGSCPFIAFDYMRVASEILGRGPAQIAMPDIKTLNLIKEMILEYGDLAIGGLWQAEDDGVINPDTIVLEPRTIIPKAAGSKGLEAIEIAGDFNLSQIVVENLQMTIRRVFNINDLGPPQGTPASATEILQRTADRAKRQAGPYSRSITEFLFPVVRRVAHIRVKQGAIKLPAIDGRTVVLKPLSPLTRAQAQDEILRHDRTLEMIAARFGPQAVNLLVKQEEYGQWLGQKMGFNPNLMRNKVELKQLAQMVASLAQQANQAGAPVAA